MTPRGALSEHAPRAILAWCEAQRFTGRLRFDAPGHGAHEVPMLAGQPELTGAPDDPAAAALERLLALDAGTFALEQCLPPRADAETATATELAGPLAEASVADLMHYCERAGLTGQLVVRGDADRACTAEYARGELVSLTLDGDHDDDVAAVFGWHQGTWRVVCRSLFTLAPARPPPPSPPPGDAFLKTVEVALADILARRDRALPSSWRPPSMRPAAARQSDVVIPRPPRAPTIESFSGPPSADTTVKVYFVQASQRAPAATVPVPVRAAADAPTEPPPEHLRHRPRTSFRAAGALPLSGADLALGAVFTAALVTAAVILASLLARA